MLHEEDPKVKILPAPNFLMYAMSQKNDAQKNYISMKMYVFAFKEYLSVMGKDYGLHSYKYH